MLGLRRTSHQCVSRKTRRPPVRLEFASIGRTIIASVIFLACGLMHCGCVESTKCHVRRSDVGRELVTLLCHLRFAKDAGAKYPEWSREYPHILRGDYRVEGPVVRLGQGGEVFGKESFLRSPQAAEMSGDIVLIATPRYIGCGDSYVVVLDNGSYHVVESTAPDARRIRNLLVEWTARGQEPEDTNADNAEK
jgi:hypothetical protein